MKRLTFVALGVALSIVGCTPRAEQPAGKSSSVKPVFEAYVAAWNKRDSTAFDTLLTSDGVHEDIALGFKGTGPAQVKGFMRDLLKSEPDYKWTVTNMIEEGSKLAAEWTWAATYTGDSPIGPVKDFHTTGRGISFVQFENGKIKHFTDYYDMASFFPKPAQDTAKK
jgi:steroid delta-isomerase-like uncharacterized protein